MKAAAQNVFARAALVVVAVLGMGAMPASAAIDIAPVTAEITSYGPLIATAGGAVLIVALGIAGIRWVKATFGG